MLDGSGPLDRLLVGEERAARAGGRAALWWTTLVALVVLSAWTAGVAFAPPVTGEWLAAPVVLAGLLASWYAARGAGLGPAVLVAGVPAWGALAAWLLAPLLGVLPVAPLPLPGHPLAWSVVPPLGGVLWYAAGRAVALLARVRRARRADGDPA